MNKCSEITLLILFLIGRDAVALCPEMMQCFEAVRLGESPDFLLAFFHIVRNPTATEASQCSFPSPWFVSARTTLLNVIFFKQYYSKK